MNDSRRTLFKKSILSAFALLPGSAMAGAASRIAGRRFSGPDPECIARIPVLGKADGGNWIWFEPQDDGSFLAYTLKGTISAASPVNASISQSYLYERAMNTWDLKPYVEGLLTGTVTIGNHVFSAQGGKLQPGSSSPVGHGTILQWSEIGAKKRVLKKRSKKRG